MYLIFRLNKRMFFYICTSIVVCFLFLSVWLVHHAMASDSLRQHNNNYVTIEAGQTLWNIAQQISKPNEDIRDVVYELCKLNHLTSPTITPGMKLLLPANR